MNLLLIGDVHNQIIDLDSAVKTQNIKGCETLDQVDLVLCTGDFETTEALNALKAQLKAPFYMVHGNHDDLDIEMDESNLHLKEVEIGNHKIRGLGGVPPDFFTCSASWESEEEMYEMWPFKNSRGGILLTHVPPYGILDRDGSGNHFGSHTVRRIMEETRPDLLICGHVHEAVGIQKICNTKILNCGTSHHLSFGV